MNIETTGEFLIIFAVTVVYILIGAKLVGLKISNFFPDSRGKK